MTDTVAQLVREMEAARDDWAEHILLGNCVNHAEYVASTASHRMVSDWLARWKDIERKTGTGDFDDEQDNQADI